MELDLKEIRKNLDTIDDQLIALFRERMQLSAQVAAYKKENNMPILDSGRESQIIERLSQAAGVEFASATRQLYQTIFQLSRAYQAELIQAVKEPRGNDEDET